MPIRLSTEVGHTASRTYRVDCRYVRAAAPAPISEIDHIVFKVRDRRQVAANRYRGCWWSQPVIRLGHRQAEQAKMLKTATDSSGSVNLQR